MGTAVKFRRLCAAVVVAFVAAALATGCGVGVAFGSGVVLGAVVGMTLAVSGISFPSFALGMLLMQYFSVNLGWLPTVGADTWKHYVLPSLTLGAAVAAVIGEQAEPRLVDRR